MRCRICCREAVEEGFCSLHLQAYRNIVDKFDVWKSASDVTWQAYLAEIQKNSLTGEWAKEVLMHIIEAGNNVEVK